MIKAINGKDEYVLLPVNAYRLIKKQIDKVISEEYEHFDLSDYVANPVAFIRIKACLTQSELADYLNVSQAYISKIEKQENVSFKTMEKIKRVLRKKGIKNLHI